MKKYLILIIITTSIIFPQIQKSGSLQSHVDSLINNMPDVVGGDEYIHPTINQLNTWGSIIDDILSTNYSDAHTTAQTIDYRLIEFTDTDPNPDKVYYMLHMNPSGTNYWGTYIFNPSPDRAQLIIQSPHPKKDFNTGKQGYYVFRENGARVFFLAGTSRCNSSDTTTCDGTTTVCNETNTDEAYKISDQAHTATGTFQRTTERIDNNFSNSIFIQLHGFSKETTDPYVIMSNGVINDTPPIGYDFLDTLDDNLLVEDNTLTFKIAHIDNWSRLAGTTNTQGRFINGSNDPCGTSAIDNTGRFLHLEQEKTKLRDDITGWTKMSNAIAATFPITPLPIELKSFTGSLIDNTVLLEWNTVTETNNYGFEVQKSVVTSQNSKENFETIGFVQGNGTTNSPKQYFYSDPLNLGLNPNLTLVSYRLKQIDNDGTVAYSKTIEVDLTTITSIDEEIKYEFELEQNYPNPFNPSTTIAFTIPGVGIINPALQHTNLAVYNSLGQYIKTIIDEPKASGYYEVLFDGSSLPSGIYYYKLTLSNKFSSVRKMLLIK